MKPSVFWYGDCRGSWCHAIVEWLTADFRHLWPATLLRDMYEGGPAIVVFKADHIKGLGDIGKLNVYLGQFDSVLLMMTANEEGTLDPSMIKHPRMRMWIQTPTRAQRQWASCGIPWGWTPGFDGTRWLERLPGYEAVEADRMLDFSFCGQVTHPRRQQCAVVLEECIRGGANGTILRTPGFGQGLPKHLYFELMLNSKVAPCPSGPITVDSFRVWEALECGTIPVVDARSPVDPSESQQDYWDYIAGPGHPLKLAQSWDETLPFVLGTIQHTWGLIQPRTVKWWAERKEFWKKKFATDLEMLSVP